MNYPTFVFWDVESCPVPHGCDPMTITSIIANVLWERLKCNQPMKISAYGKMTAVPEEVQMGLSSSSVLFHAVSSDPSNSVEKDMLIDLMLFAADNQATTNVVVISGNIGYADALHVLSTRSCNIILVFPDKNIVETYFSGPKFDLKSIAKTIWLWSELANGGPPSMVDDSSDEGSSSNYEVA